MNIDHELYALCFVVGIHLAMISGFLLKVLWIVEDLDKIDKK